ncbi:hypothetical protein H6F86_03490 [Phormidium sp. FACHB-592]|uniref:Uncharacterized protein n=1 Tax=Stenomitos frigidus AS-A4 TaxID=2933935 RepID=A0ABV0KNQ0_9CYAN|nr:MULTISPECIES: hypothetical protein [Cyanophyceae]MBD2036346.1 hypothetical protein [Leptolyngbya sp. FACHB-321]MBD2072963.1 hypothetical protein [Phormidium sp. FACHB-592]
MQYIKPLLGIGLIAIALYVGFVGISPWIILLVGIVFTAAYIQDKWFLWHDLFQRRDRAFYQSLLITYLIQVVVVAILYLLGLGIGRLIGL